jgi:hypothetical protein
MKWRSFGNSSNGAKFWRCEPKHGGPGLDIPTTRKDWFFYVVDCNIPARNLAIAALTMPAEVQDAIKTIGFECMKRH